MAQNEMRAKPALPERVRSMEGLGGAGGTAALALVAAKLAESEQRETLTVGVVFTTGSVPELRPMRHRVGMPTLRLPIRFEFLLGILHLAAPSVPTNSRFRTYFLGPLSVTACSITSPTIEKRTMSSA